MSKKILNKKSAASLFLLSAILFLCVIVNSETALNEELIGGSENMANEVVQEQIRQPEESENMANEIVQEQVRQTKEVEEIKESETDIIQDGYEQIEGAEENETNTIQANQNNIEYLNLDLLINKSSEATENSTEIEEKDTLTNKKINFTLFSTNNKIELKGEVDEGIELNKIEEVKSLKNGGNWIKEIIIKSPQHIESQLINYEDIPEIAATQKKDVKIYWVNENIEIEIKEFIDENGDGLFERVSWIVPHLSEQVFQIVINFSIESSNNLIIDAIKTPQGQVENPIEFSFNINYNTPENLNCTLSIDMHAYFINTENQSFTWPYSLPNGNHTWLLHCCDLYDGTEKSVLGNFAINENFSISGIETIYSLKESVNFTINSRNNTETEIKLIPPNSTMQDIARAYMYPSTIILNAGVLAQEGFYILNITSYALASPINALKNFSVAKIEFNANKNKTKVGDLVIFSLNINSPIEKITSIIIDFGDGSSNLSYYSLNENAKVIDFYHNYTNKRNYTVSLKTIISNKVFIKQALLEIENYEDDEPPKITMLEPEEGEVTENDQITFSYTAEDDVKITNCTFELYNYSERLGILDYRGVHTNLQNNELKEIRLQNFKEGPYSWSIFCCDNSSNCNNDLDYNRDFSVRFNSSTNNTRENTTHEKKQEIILLTSNIDNFLTKTDFSAEEKEALEDLGILKDLEYYKKRLAQMDQDLTYNLKFITDGALREKRRQEIIEEIEKIKEQTPTNIKIQDKHEFAKNSITQNMGDIVKDYIEAKDISLDKAGIKKLAELNYKIQNYINVLTKVKQVEIVYSEHKKELTLIKKEITLKNESIDKFLEIVPKSIAQNASELTFLTEATIIKQDPIFEVDFSGLENKSLIYYADRFIDPKEIEQTDTVLFKEFPLKRASITGFFILDLTEISSPLYYITILIFMVLVLFLAMTCVKKVKINKWKKEENVVRIFNLLKESKRASEKNEFNKVKEIYSKIKELYPLIPEKCQKYLYKKIKKISLTIDKKDIFELIQEYKEAKKQGRKENEAVIYKSIQSAYKKLPKKYKEPVYNQIFKPSLDLQI